MTDGVLKMMKDAGIAISRKNFLLVNFLGDAPDSLAEEEADLPEFVRKPRTRARFSRKDRRLLRRMKIQTS